MATGPRRETQIDLVKHQLPRSQTSQVDDLAQSIANSIYLVLGGTRVCVIHSGEKEMVLKER